MIREYKLFGNDVCQCQCLHLWLDSVSKPFDLSSLYLLVSELDYETIITTDVETNIPTIYHPKHFKVHLAL